MSASTPGTVTGGCWQPPVTVTHGTFDLTPAKRASQIIDRELDVLADQAAARRLDDPRAVQNALRTIATTATQLNTSEQDILRRRLKNLEPDATPRSRIVDHAVRLATLTIGAGVLTAICLSIHATSIWLGVAACGLLVASLYTFTRPVITPRAPTTPRPSPRIDRERGAANPSRTHRS